jgi:hypothetical protein
MEAWKEKTQAATFTSWGSSAYAQVSLDNAPKDMSTIKQKHISLMNPSQMPMANMGVAAGNALYIIAVWAGGAGLQSGPYSITIHGYYQGIWK